ncbi:MAG: 2Fe-2S iron-sulfur cluster-binding protein [Candidatus Woesearchaeota archaeon]
MAKVIINDMEFDIPDGQFFKEEAERAGVPFGCTEGICGSCFVEVEQGEENLSELTQEEKDMGMNPKERLACQCKAKSGHIKLRY